MHFTKLSNGFTSLPQSDMSPHSSCVAIWKPEANRIQKCNGFKIGMLCTGLEDPHDIGDGTQKWSGKEIHCSTSHWDECKSRGNYLSYIHNLPPATHNKIHHGTRLLGNVFSLFHWTHRYSELSRIYHNMAQLGQCLSSKLVSLKYSCMNEEFENNAKWYL